MKYEKLTEAVEPTKSFSGSGKEPSGGGQSVGSIKLESNPSKTGSVENWIPKAKMSSKFCDF